MDGEITIGTKLETKEFDKQIQDLEYKLEDLEKQKLYFQENEMVGEFRDVEVEIEKTQNKLVSLRQQKERLANSGDVNRLVDGFKNFGNSIQNSISKVTRLALGIFGIRSAYMALRRASSDLANYDEQYATNLEYIRYALTQAIAPVLRYIVNLAATLLGYINAIMQGWFGINLFARGSAENFNKMKAGAGGISKAVKEIKKQLAGFDEINMLTDQSDTGTSAGAGGVGMPNFDLSKLQGEPPEWLKWIIDHKDEILSILLGIATALTLIEFGLKPLTALGIGAIITGILLTIEAIKDYLEAPTWENFGKIIQGIGIILAGLLGLILGVPRNRCWCSGICSWNNNKTLGTNKIIFTKRNRLVNN